MTWDHLEAAVFSAGIRSHRTASGGLAPERTFPRTSVAFSLSFADLTDSRARNVARSWLVAVRSQTERDRHQAARAGQDKEASFLNERYYQVDSIIRQLGPMEIGQEELAQAVALGLRLQGSA